MPPQPLDKDQSITGLGAETTYFVTEQVSRLFQERTKEKYKTRYTATIANTSMMAAFTDPGLRVRFHPDGATEYRLSGKASKRLAELKEELFSLFE